MTELNRVKGIGPRHETLLHKLNINSIEDLVTHYPFRYDILKRDNLTITNDGDKIVIDGKIESTPILLRFKGGLNKMNFRLMTTYGPIGVSIFNRAFLKKQLLVGSGITVIGKFDKNKNVVTASDIKLGFLANQARIEAVYHTTNGLTSKNLSTFINLALLTCGKEIPDYIPEHLMKEYSFSNKKTALNIIHNPPNEAKLKEATIRLKYEELFTFMFKINYLKEQNHQKNMGLSKIIEEDKVKELIVNLPFTLTKDQEISIWEIIKDMKSKSRMNRLLQGDVGSGKTIVAFISMYANYLSGYQSALMAPTEILAFQHYQNLTTLLKGTNIKIALLTGSIVKKEKQKLYESLENGTTNIVIGTHALIQDEVKYHNLGLVITDEQHRFGVAQRTSLQNKGIKPDILYMSATPIPRTYALTIYGDMDVSTIKERPNGRLPVITKVMKTKEMSTILKNMYEELKNNHQIYVIAPLIEESENSDLTAVCDLKDKMKLAFGSKCKIDIVHGKMAQEAKDKVMNDFLNNDIQILISTTVIEVGIDVANATMMVIFDANRFGLSTLHQLRGRVGRSNIQSYCILISDNDTKRLEIMEMTNDGFIISEEDFHLRGHGDLFGTKQSGDMTFKIASLKQDYKILLQAKKDSYDYLLNDNFNNEILKQDLIKSVKEN